MKTCNHCGGLVATEPEERTAGTICEGGRSSAPCSRFRVWTEYTNYAGHAIQGVHDVEARDEFWAGLEAQERHPVHVVGIVRVEKL